jgi:dipeptidyl aminopeptidase/acylaminoacyl peptidase
MVWLERTGALRPLRTAAAVWGNPRFSPDGRRIAMTIADGTQQDVWVYDVERDTLTRITSDPAIDAVPVWMPDGQRLIFGSTRGDGRPHLYWQRADGTGNAEQLTEGPRPELPDDVDSSGRFLIYHDGDPTSGGQRLMVLPLEGIGASGWKPGPPREVIRGNAVTALPEFSPDGRFVAYASAESGRIEIYVLPFPGPGTRVQVSSDGGNLPRWSPTSHELFYASGARPERMMRVPFRVEGGAFIPAKAELWTDTRFSPTTPFAAYGPGFDLHPDGQRFVVAPPVESAVDNRGQSQVVFILNFFSELRARATN